MRGSVRLTVEVRKADRTVQNVLTLQDVLYCPALNCRLISERKLDLNGLSVVKSAGKALVYIAAKQGQGQVNVVTATVKAGLYHVHLKEQPDQGDSPHRDMNCNQDGGSCESIPSDDEGGESDSRHPVTSDRDQYNQETRHEESDSRNSTNDLDRNTSRRSPWDGQGTAEEGEQEYANTTRRPKTARFGSNRSKGVSPLELLHRRLFHVNNDTAMKMVGWANTKRNGEDFCEACDLGKAPREALPKTRSQTLVHPGLYGYAMTSGSQC